VDRQRYKAAPDPDPTQSFAYVGIFFFTFTPGKKYSLSFHLVEKDTVQILIRQNYADPTGSGSTTLP
jgi:hypothetical protein